MAQYIDKDTVDIVLRKLWKKDNGLSNADRYAYNRALQDIQCEIDALEVKEDIEHYELEEFARIVRGNLTGIDKTVQTLFEAKYQQLTGHKMYGGYKD